MTDSFLSVLDPLVRYGLPLSAFVLSFATFFVVKWNWRQGNRPIVAAAFRTHATGNEAILYDLVVFNVGNRPATDIRIAADLVEVAACLADLNMADESDPMWKNVLRCFSPQGHIPLLTHGREATNSFGYTGSAGGKGSFWRYGSGFAIQITYFDLDGKSYTSIQKLVVKNSEAFASGKWSKSPSE
jgi:hypothetical protein